MEKGAYLTDIDTSSNSHQPPLAKFSKLANPPGKNCPSASESQMRKVPTRRKLHKNLYSFLPDEYYATKKVKPGIGFYRVISR
jgi:hypothetical protein